MAGQDAGRADAERRHVDAGHILHHVRPAPGQARVELLGAAGGVGAGDGGGGPGCPTRTRCGGRLAEALSRLHRQQGGDQRPAPARRRRLTASRARLRRASCSGVAVRPWQPSCSPASPRGARRPQSRRSRPRECRAAGGTGDGSWELPYRVDRPCTGAVAHIGC